MCKSTAANIQCLVTNRQIFGICRHSAQTILYPRNIVITTQQFHPTLNRQRKTCQPEKRFTSLYRSNKSKLATEDFLRTVITFLGVLSSVTVQQTLQTPTMH